MGDINAVKEQIVTARGQLAEGDKKVAAVEEHRMRSIQIACRVLALLGEAAELLAAGEADGIGMAESMQASSIDAEGAYTNASAGIGALCIGSENPALANAGTNAAAAGRSMFDRDIDSGPCAYSTASEIGAQWEVAADFIGKAQGSLRATLQYTGAVHSALHDARLGSMEATLSLDGYMKQITGT